MISDHPRGFEKEAGMNNKRFLFARFQGTEILEEYGRNLYLLLNVFASSGYEIKVFNNLANRNLEKYGQLIYSLENLELTEAPPKCTDEWVYLFDKEDRATGRLAWYKKIQVRYDVFSTYRFRNPVIMPFSMHPAHVTQDLKRRLEDLRSRKSNMRIFFSGDTSGYTRNRIRYPKAKLPRLKIINTILDRMETEVLYVKDMSMLGGSQREKNIRKCVIVDTNETWVDERDWLGYLARADFFLSPPGIIMPMCHNVIEAMAVGSIPICNYPEWFTPDLTHMENCIAFDDQDDLIAKLKLALAMGEEEILRMRTNVLNYYETHLKPDTFLHRIESSKDKKVIVLIITEANMLRYSSKLKKSSVLMRGVVPGMFL
jgi:hypothetical protein